MLTEGNKIDWLCTEVTLWLETGTLVLWGSLKAEHLTSEAGDRKACGTQGLPLTDFLFWDWICLE